MAGQSLGLIETVGLGVAIEAADAAMKSANVDLVGYELTKGGGLVTVKLAGDVGAINAAVSAGVAAANRVGSVYAWKVIARTAQGINALIASQETTGLAPRPPLPEEKVAKKSQNKETVIPVANLEPLESSSDCMALSDDTLFATAASQRATESAVISKDELPVKNAEIAEKAPHNNATAPLSTEVNKPLKPRHKGPKR